MLNLRLEDQAGDVMKKFRYGRKRSLREVSKESSLAVDLLRSLESGETSPTPGQLSRLGEILGFDGTSMALLHLHPEATPDALPPPAVVPVHENYGGYAVWCALVLHPNDPLRALLVDTGGGGSILLETIRKRGLKIEGILLTHGHGDHGGGFQGAITDEKIPVLLSKKDFSLLPDIETFGGSLLSPEEGCRLLSGKGWSVSMSTIPGHTPGSVAYRTEGTLFVGDTLFCGSAGRSFTPDDFPTQLASIRRLVEENPPETVVISGHGPFTTLGDEKRVNPFVRVRENPFWK